MCRACCCTLDFASTIEVLIAALGTTVDLPLENVVFREDETFEWA